jgi:hypothetical protein
MATKKTTEIVGEIVELLKPLDPAERNRVIQASLMLLGDPISVGQHLAVGEGGSAPALPPRARSWMKQSAVSREDLQQVFHLEDGSAEVIAGEIPGKNKKEKTYAAYVLTGLSKLLSTGSPAFDDKAARALCESSGCYDAANHSVHIKQRGNEFTGTKEKGWTLTAPGLQRAAALVKEIAKN